MTFVVFILLALFMKFRERKFCRNGRTYEEYREFLTTKRNSLNFSVYAAIILVVMGIVDLFIAIVVPMIIMGSQLGMELAASGTVTAELEAALTSNLQRMFAIGFGESIPLIFLAPFMLLFSYNRKRKHPEYDSVIPLGAIILIILTYFQGIYQIAWVIPFDKTETTQAASVSGTEPALESETESEFDLGSLIMMFMMMSEMEDMDFSTMDAAPETVPALE